MFLMNSPPSGAPLAAVYLCKGGLGSTYGTVAAEYLYFFSTVSELSPNMTK